MPQNKNLPILPQDLTDVTGTLATGHGGTGTTANVNVANGVVVLDGSGYRSEERRVGKECRSRWSPYH